MFKKGDNVYVVYENLGSTDYKIYNLAKDIIHKENKKSLVLKNSKLKFTLEGNLIEEEENKKIFIVKEDSISDYYNELNLNNKLKSLKENFSCLNAPPSHRVLNVGDKVSYRKGNLGYTVSRVFENGMFYEIISDNGDIDVHSWIEIFPNKFNKDFELKEDAIIELKFNSTLIRELISFHYSYGYNLDPEYQRGYVWTMEDKINLIDSIFNNIEIGKFAVIENDYPDRYEILDGKQRLTTILEFYEDRFKYKGKYYSELSMMDKHHFYNYKITVADCRNLTLLDKLRYFKRLNCGKNMDKFHLDKIDKKIKEMIEEGKN